jgi:hypothetical protein
MQIIFSYLFSILLITSTHAQEDERSWFDFWVGKWEVTWTDANGKQGKGTNTIDKILGNTVIRENFEAHEGQLKGYLGTSISVYNPRTKMWHQGYADNQGAYFNFTGERQGDKRIFKTSVVEEGTNSLMWDWESSEDGGESWTLNWRISYKKI